MISLMTISISTCRGCYFENLAEKKNNHVFVEIRQIGIKFLQKRSHNTGKDQYNS